MVARLISSNTERHTQRESSFTLFEFGSVDLLASCCSRRCGGNRKLTTGSTFDTISSHYFPSAMRYCQRRHSANCSKTIYSAWTYTSSISHVRPCLINTSLRKATSRRIRDCRSRHRRSVCKPSSSWRVFYGNRYKSGYGDYDRGIHESTIHYFIGIHTRVCAYCLVIMSWSHNTDRSWNS